MRGYLLLCTVPRQGIILSKVYCIMKIQNNIYFNTWNVHQCVLPVFRSIAYIPERERRERGNPGVGGTPSYNTTLSATKSHHIINRSTVTFYNLHKSKQTIAMWLRKEVAIIQELFCTQYRREEDAWSTTLFVTYPLIHYSVAHNIHYHALK